MWWFIAKSAVFLCFSSVSMSCFACRHTGMKYVKEWCEIETSSDKRKGIIHITCSYLKLLKNCVKDTLYHLFVQVIEERKSFSCFYSVNAEKLLEVSELHPFCELLLQNSYHVHCIWMYVLLYVRTCVTEVYISWSCVYLTLILLTWRIWWAPNNASKWQMGFKSAFKGLMALPSPA
jgi:hypothetical protein